MFKTELKIELMLDLHFSERRLECYSCSVSDGCINRQLRKCVSGVFRRDAYVSAGMSNQQSNSNQFQVIMSALYTCINVIGC